MGLLFSIKYIRGLVVGLQGIAFRVRYGRHAHGRLRVFGWPIIQFAKGSTVNIGSNVMLVSHSRLSEPGVSHPCVLRTLTPQAVLTIGHDVGMSGITVCAADHVMIGDECLLGADVFISDTDFHPITPSERRYRTSGIRHAPVEIGSNVFVGARSMILKGVTIGDDAVIAAGSVVTADIPAKSIAAGVPARVIGSVDE